LSELGREATRRACEALPKLLKELGYDEKLAERGYLTPNEVGRLRDAVREELRDSLEEINKLTVELLGTRPTGKGGLFDYL
jgi:hypothetical protein